MSETSQVFNYRIKHLWHEALNNHKKNNLLARKFADRLFAYVKQVKRTNLKTRK